MENTNQKKKKNRKKILVRALTRLVYLLAIGLLVVVSGFWSFSTVQYSPLPAEFAPKTLIKIKGQILFGNLSIEDQQVRVFATDQQKEELVPVDSEGWFYSVFEYESGQLLTFTINGQRLDPYSVFLPYEMDTSTYFDVGLFVIRS